MLGDVKTWPTYLLKRVPADLRLALSLEAAERDYSLADLIREILCEHYGLDCPRRQNPHRSEPIGYGEHGGKDGRAETLVMRLQPELFAAIQAEMEETGRYMRDAIIEILEAHFAR